MRPQDIKKFITEEIKRVLMEDMVSRGIGDNTSVNSIDPKQLDIGIAVEMEHTSKEKLAQEIAIDHLTESPTYYSDLVKAGMVDEPKALAIYEKYFETLEQ